jgi:deoxyribodipyrimidine photo-lyase
MGSRRDVELSEELVRLSASPRVLVRRDGAPLAEGKCVVYWMQRSMRILDNPALDVAIEAGNILGLPVVVFFSLIPNYPNANWRHYRFLAEGLADIAEDAAERGVGFVLRRHPDSAVAPFLAEVQAAMVVGDENPCREPERWRRTLAARLNLPYWTVDADVVVPSRVFGRDFFLMHHFRPHLKKELAHFLMEPLGIQPLHRWQPTRAIEGVTPDLHAPEAMKGIDRRVRPTDAFKGGTHAAVAQMRRFVSSMLADYETNRNRPELAGTSRLSPYLHFGHIGPFTIARAAEEAVRAGKTSAAVHERFLEQLIGWRELSVLFVRHNPDYDNWKCAEPWAQKTLTLHSADQRPALYSLEQLERAETGDDLWNAAQQEMVETGWMHNYMRMYWAKKILDWTPNPAVAFEWAVILNDRYELDGRDPNGYAGIAWAIVGKHDRPWFNRPVFGLVRPMSGASLAKKFNAQLYIRQNSN